MTRLPLIAAALVAFGADAATRFPSATPAGKPENCIQISQIDHTEVRDDRTVDFIMRGRAVYRNTLPDACPELGFERSFAYETSLSQLCNVDIITVLRQTPQLQRGASCGLGTFQPVTLAR